MLSRAVQLSKRSCDVRVLRSLGVIGFLMSLLLLFNQPAPAHAFGFYTPVTIDHTKVGGSDASNYPVLITGNVAQLKTVANGGHVQNANGFDLRPYSDTGASSALSFELVSYDATAGTFEMRVKIPTVSHTVDTTFYLFYGDATITTDGSSTATWDTSYSGVWHLPNGSSLSANDSTANANNGTLVGTPTPTTGQIDGAANFSGSNYIEITDNGALNESGDYAIECWLEGGSSQASFAGIVVKVADVLNNQAYGLQLNSGSNLAVFYADNISHFDTGISAASVTDGAAHSIVITKNTSTIASYLDGAFVTSASPGTQGTGTGVLRIGIERTTAQGWAGWIDEVKVSSVARSADWVTASYNNESSPSTFVSYGTEVPLSSSTFAAVSLSQSIALAAAAASIAGVSSSLSLSVCAAAGLAIISSSATSESQSTSAAQPSAQVSAAAPSISQSTAQSTGVLTIAAAPNSTSQSTASASSALTAAAQSGSTSQSTANASAAVTATAQASSLSQSVDAAAAAVTVASPASSLSQSVSAGNGALTITSPSPSLSQSWSTAFGQASVPGVFAVSLSQSTASAAGLAVIAAAAPSVSPTTASALPLVQIAAAPQSVSQSTAAVVARILAAAASASTSGLLATAVPAVSVFAAAPSISFSLASAGGFGILPHVVVPPYTVVIGASRNTVTIASSRTSATLALSRTIVTLSGVDDA